MTLPSTTKTKTVTAIGQIDQWSEPGVYAVGFPQVTTRVATQRVFVPVLLSKASASSPGFKTWRPLEYWYATSGASGLAQSWDNWIVWPSGLPTKFLKSRNSSFSAVSATYGFPSWFDWEGDLQAQLDRSLFSKLKRLRSTYDLGVTLGEGRETLNTLVSGGVRLVNAFSAFRQRRLVEALNILTGSHKPPKRSEFIHRRLKRRAVESTSWETSKDLSSNWLEFSYGWMPLVNDVFNFAEYIAHRALNDSSSVRRVTVKGKVLRHLENTTAGVTQRSICSVSRRCTYLVAPNWGEGQVNSVVQELGLHNPALIAWQLLPLSFVVDWFVNVGQVLDSLQVFQDWRVLDGLLSERRHKRYTEITSISTAYYSNQSIWFVDRNDFRRRINVAWPTAVPLVFGRDSDLSLSQYTSLVALMRQTFR